MHGISIRYLQNATVQSRSSMDFSGYVERSRKRGTISDSIVQARQLYVFDSKAMYHIMVKDQCTFEAPPSFLAYVFHLCSMFRLSNWLAGPTSSFSGMAFFLRQVRVAFYMACASFLIRIYRRTSPKAAEVAQPCVFHQPRTAYGAYFL